MAHGTLDDDKDTDLAQPLPTEIFDLSDPSSMCDEWLRETASTNSIGGILDNSFLFVCGDDSTASYTDIPCFVITPSYDHYLGTYLNYTATMMSSVVLVNTDLHREMVYITGGRGTLSDIYL